MLVLHGRHVQGGHKKHPSHFAHLPTFGWDFGHRVLLMKCALDIHKPREKGFFQKFQGITEQWVFKAVHIELSCVLFKLLWSFYLF